jgi:MFS family permease
MRRAFLLVAAVGTFVEGVALAGGLVLLSAIVQHYSMSLNHADPDTARVVLWVLAGLVTCYFFGLTAVLVTAAVRDRSRRGLIIAATWVQVVLTVVTGVVSHGWAFVFMLAMCGLYLGILFGEPRTAEPRTAEPRTAQSRTAQSRTAEPGRPAATPAPR